MCTILRMYMLVQGGLHMTIEVAREPSAQENRPDNAAIPTHGGARLGYLLRSTASSAERNAGWDAFVSMAVRADSDGRRLAQTSQLREVSVLISSTSPSCRLDFEICVK